MKLIVVNDDGTMKQVALFDVKTYIGSTSVSGDTFATDLKAGHDADNLIDFTTDNVITFRVNEENIGSFTENSGNFIIKPLVDEKDIIFQQRDGTEVVIKR